MSEWWSYRLPDLLMFSPRSYWRLVELYNRAIWPAQLPVLAAGVLALWLAARSGPASRRMLGPLLALAWFWVAWAFHWQRYAQIHLAAPWFAVAFALQGLMLLAWALLPERNAQAPPRALRVVGLLVVAAAVLAYPLAAPAFGRPLAQAEVAGIMPEPTALATLGVVLALARPMPLQWLLVAIPLAWLLVAAATLWTMAAQ